MTKLIKPTIFIILCVIQISRAAYAEVTYRYFYDDLARLNRVTDSSGVSIEYIYDETGNIRSTVNTTIALFAIVNLRPAGGPVGTRVVLEGRGFSDAPGENIVTFNGAVAAVATATATRLEVEVPADAASGPVSVTVGAESVISSSDFQVVNSPIVTEISNQFVLSGTPIPSLLVSGSNLDGASFVFIPDFVPAAVSVAGIDIAAGGESASLEVFVSDDAIGTFVLQATNAAGQSDSFSSIGNTLTVLGSANDDLDGDGLSNGEEIELGTDPTTGDSDGDGLPDLFEITTGLDPNDSADAFLDNDNDGIRNLDEFNQGTDPLNPDTVPPIVSQVAPDDTETDFATNASVVVRFSEPLRSDSVVVGSVRLFQGTLGVAGAVRLSDDQLSITFEPNESLSAFTDYRVQVQGLRDTAGNGMIGTFESNFTTGEFIDDVAPLVSGTNIASGTTDVPVNTSFSVEFNEPMDPASLTTDTFIVRDNVNGADVAGMIQVDSDGKTAAFVPNLPFAVGRSFSVFLFSSITDTSGNRLSFNSFSFTTSFSPDTSPIQLLSFSPSNSAAEVATNSVITLKFDEPLDAINIRRGLSVLNDNGLVEGSIALSEGNQLVTFTPAIPLQPNLPHTVSYLATITDLAGNELANPGEFTFTTGNLNDTQGPTLVNVSPRSRQDNTPINLSMVQVTLTEPVSVTSINENNYYLFEADTGERVAATVDVASDGFVVNIKPNIDLEPLTEYRVFLGDIRDYANNRYIGTSSPTRFTTGLGAVDEPLMLTSSSLQDGQGQISVNPELTYRFSSVLSEVSLGGSTVELIAADGSVIAGVLVLSDDGLGLSFVPDGLLSANTGYTLTIAGLSDVAGNELVTFSQEFTTGISGVADEIRPTLAGVFPVNGATEIAADVVGELTFSERLNPLTLAENITLQRLDSPTVTVPTTLSLSPDGFVVSVTPEQPLQGGIRYRYIVSTGVEDLSGNRYSGSSIPSTFTVSESVPADTQAPMIVLVTPEDGAEQIGLDNPVVVSFSEVLDPSTISRDTISLFANGSRLFPSVFRSSDNRTVTLDVNLPADSEIALTVSGEVRDLAGNAVSDFSSGFSTGPAFDGSTPRVTSQRPHNGASDVPLDQSIVLYTDESLLASSIANALFVSQNGVLVSGETRLTGDDRGIEFTPDDNWENDALVQIFLTEDATDVSGNALRRYQGSFRVVANDSDRRPRLVRVSTDNFFSQNEVPLNPVLEFEYSEALDGSGINSGVVGLQNNTDSTTVGVTVSLVGDRIVRVVPDTELQPDTGYSVFSNTLISDLDGEVTSGPSTFFITGTASDNSPPMVELISPPGGASGVPVNAGIRMRFNERVNPISVTAETILVSDGFNGVLPCTISFSNDNRDVLIIPHSPFESNTQYEIEIVGVTDQSGNSVIPLTSQFITGNGVDTDNPLQIASSPFSGAVDVPVNSPILIQVNEPLDPVTIDQLFVSDNTTGDQLAGSVSLSSDGRVVSFAPGEVLGVGRSHSVFDNGMTDLANNPLFTGFSFTTSFDEDVTAPTIFGISPGEGLESVPTNARVVVRFDEPMQSLSAEEVSLSAGGEAVEVIRLWSDGNRVLTLTPTLPLEALTSHTVTIPVSVEDTAGNNLVEETVSEFTTGAGIDLVLPVLSFVEPMDDLQDVPTNAVMRVGFSKRINPLTVTDSTFWLERTTGGTTRIEAQIEVAADGLSASLTPTQELDASSNYRVRLSGVQDLVGQNYSGSSVPSSFTIGLGQ